MILGYLVGQEELHTKEFEVTLNLVPPMMVKGIQRASEHFGWNIEISCQIMLRQPFTYQSHTQGTLCSSQMSSRFSCSQAMLTAFPCLVATDWKKPFHVYCDALTVAVGATLHRIKLMVWRTRTILLLLSRF